MVAKNTRPRTVPPRRKAKVPADRSPAAIPGAQENTRLRRRRPIRSGGLSMPKDAGHFLGRPQPIHCCEYPIPSPAGNAPVSGTMRRERHATGVPKRMALLPYRRVIGAKGRRPGKVSARILSPGMLSGSPPILMPRRNTVAGRPGRPFPARSFGSLRPWPSGPRARDPFRHSRASRPASSAFPPRLRPAPGPSPRSCAQATRPRPAPLAA
ncbi:hypothetical protein XINFAN_02135 [Pseudogemmobacter humi]|uniref:Uncharacterized protein n=1 Tax=Pseudogemmobacter humi TaxID=2483812 RepID=A0A3P5XJ00_9RHOB|nr:hypothetical protein XINFAN_02135 [Pseudogemmobacter humi]